MREMIDCTSANLAHVQSLFPNPQVWAAYITGSPDVRYTDAQLASIPDTAVTVTIDQGYTGSPVPTAIVRDVEFGAWSPKNAVDKTNWHTERPTIYCDRYDLTRAGGVLASGWQGDLWLAIPSVTAPLISPVIPGCNVVAVQWNFTGSYDKSIVFDDTWPVKQVTTVPEWQVQMMQALPVVKQGDSGSFVRSVQGLCVARGHVIAVDGIFGVNTHNAVIAVQKAAHIAVDGIVGQQTWPILVGV